MHIGGHLACNSAAYPCTTLLGDSNVMDQVPRQFTPCEASLIVEKDPARMSFPATDGYAAT